MERRKRNAYFMIAFSLALIAGLTLYVVADSRFFGIALVGGGAGLVHASDFYTPNNNVSYEVSFHDVNFTFMYWIYPRDAPTDGPYTAYFLIEFKDNSSEVINIQTGSWWLVHGSMTLPLTAKYTVDTSPIAGVLYHGYMDSPVGWRFIVSVF
ncbi:MAG: hypothetical protein ACXACG_15180 [Candidatus Thorarchaeota archaeon]